MRSFEQSGKALQLVLRLWYVVHCSEPSACKLTLLVWTSFTRWYPPDCGLVMMPPALAALTMESAGKAASEMEMERIKRFPQIVVKNAQPD